MQSQTSSQKKVFQIVTSDYKKDSSPWASRTMDIKEENIILINTAIKMSLVYNSNSF